MPVWNHTGISVVSSISFENRPDYSQLVDSDLRRAIPLDVPHKSELKLKWRSDAF
jgi:hypothetical protein